MPEGDTVHKVARVLEGCLVGQVLSEVELRGVFEAHKLAGRKVDRVEPVGKHFLIEMGEHTLRVHLGMHGAWERHPGRYPRKADVRLVSPRDTLLCFQPKEVEVFPTRDRKRHPVLNRLGPDLLGPDPDLEEVLRRARAYAGAVGEMLLAQRVAAGLGNVYKSEVAFMEGISPWTPAPLLSEAELRALYRRGRDLLLANLGGWPRTTVVDARITKLPPGSNTVWVYGRVGRPCLRCGQEVQVRMQGLESRSTYWCPRCQPQR